jgi:hypothetical protein
VFVAHELWLDGIDVAPSTVRAVWQRRGLTLCAQRLAWLERDTGGAGTDSADRASASIG